VPRRIPDPAEAMTRMSSPSNKPRRAQAGAKRLRSLQQPPLALQAREAILSAILDGKFVTRLPREEELAEMLNVSRTTVRSAVQDLERDGLVTRRRATGTVINRHVGFETLALQRLVPFEWLLRKKGHEVEVEIAWERRVPTEVADELPWDGKEECLVLDKRFLADGRLAIALRDYIPWSELRSTDLRDPIESSLFEFSRRRCHRTIANAVAQIIPMVVRGKKSTALDLPSGRPFIRLREAHYDDRGDPVACSYIDLDDRVLRLEVFRGQ
jgi:GntR family transcriptional regulator